MVIAYVIVSCSYCLPFRFVVETGQEGNTVGAIRSSFLPKSFISDGSIGLSCVVRE